MAAFWNITMDRKMQNRFDNYRKEFEKQTGAPVSKAEFGRFIFEFWEKSIEHHFVKIERHKEEIEKHEQEIDVIKKLSRAG